MFQSFSSLLPSAFTPSTHPNMLAANYQVSDQIRGADSAPGSSWMQRKRAEVKKTNPVAL